MTRLAPTRGLPRIVALGAIAALVPLGGLAGPAGSGLTPTASAQGLGADCAAVRDGTASWGIKESFRRYLTGPIGMGGWDLQEVGFTGVQGGPDGKFQFTADPAASSVHGQDADVALKGSVSLHAHFGLLKIDLSHMSVHVRGNQAQFIADFTSNTVNRPTADATITGHETGTQVPIASFTLDAPIDANAVRGGSFSVGGAGVITQDGNRAFGGNYGEGNNQTDRLDLRVGTVPGVCTSGGLSQLKAAAPATGGGQNAGGGTAADSGQAPPLQVAAPQRSQATSGGTSSRGGSAAPQGKGAAESSAAGGGQVCTEADAKGVADARLSWGVKDSFRSYLQSGVAKGGWTTSGGAVYNSGAFVFSGDQGGVNPSNDSGTVSYGGAVTFTGHEGVLNTVISNPELRFSGNSGTLVADVSSNDTNGNPRSYGRIALVDLAVSGGVSGDVLDGTASTTLTAAGAEAMAGFYPQGTPMSPLTFKASLSGSATCAQTSGAASGNASAAKSGLGAMPKNEAKPAPAKADGRSATSLLDNTASESDIDDSDTIPMALATNPGVPIGAALLVIALGVLLYRVARNRRADALAAEQGEAGADGAPGETGEPGAADASDHTDTTTPGERA